MSNAELSCPGVKLHGSGFIVTTEQAAKLGLGRVPGLDNYIRRYCNGQDLTATSRDVLVIDLLGLSAEETRRRFPEVYQWVLERVRPEREHNNRPIYRQKWWLFGEPRIDFRPALEGLSRFIATTESARRRFFVFIDGGVLPDNSMVNIASDDAFVLGVLSSGLHVTWALAAGGRLGVRNDPRYNKTKCFEPFPFPACAEPQKNTIRELAETLDAHRKRQQQLYPKLKLTKVYKVLAMVRENAALGPLEHKVHEQGLVSVLRDLHDRLDTAVLAAYGWPHALSEDEILEKLVALNAERAAEESRGQVRWLRRDYQKPRVQARLPGGVTRSTPPSAQLEIPWPKDLPDQVAAVRDMLLMAAPAMLTAKEVANAYSGAPIRRVVQALQTLEALGDAASSKSGSLLRWKGLAKATGERPGRAKAS